MSLLDRLTVRWRRRRFRWVQRVVQRPTDRPLRVLDIGGTVDYWSAMPWQPLGPVEIVLLNLTAQPTAAPFTAVVGDARDLSRYPDRSFDLVYSNSVLGHVGTFDDQRRMASELQRVGRQFILQTPNQRFPVDWRTLVPGFHLLPLRAQAWLVHRTRVGRYPRVHDPEAACRLVGRVRNVTRQELRVLFPTAAIHCERMFGFTKSFVVVGDGRNGEGGSTGTKSRPRGHIPADPCGRACTEAL